jgi:hypothetical protein
MSLSNPYLACSPFTSTILKLVRSQNHESKDTYHNDGIVLLLEPVDGVLPSDLVLGTNLGRSTFATSDSATWTGKADVEVHTVDAYACLNKFPLSHF